MAPSLHGSFLYVLIVSGHRSMACASCAKPPLQAPVFRLHKHAKAGALPLKENKVTLLKQSLRSLQAQAWGARGRVFESLRPDHIIQ